MADAVPQATSTPQRVVRQLESLAHQAGARRAQVDGRTFAAAGMPGYQCKNASEELHEGVFGGQACLVAAQPFHHVYNADLAIGGGHSAQKQGKQNGAEDGQGEPLDMREQLE